ncbi:FAD/NAD(P)-binding domain-containing protein [Xylariaceae sp. FL0016]|nr:FAD/NAD(P)-binding domain-containing protein [Xylariaceae sp. FL0016]
METGKMIEVDEKRLLTWKPRRFAMAATMDVMVKDEYPDIERELGHRALSFHRVDLHRGLRELATREGEGDDGVPVEVRLGCEVVGVDCEDGVLRLADGTTMQKDLVVIADGAHSHLLSDFLGRESPAQHTGRSIYRWLVSMDDVMADPELAGLFRGELPGFLAYIDPLKNSLWIMYACRGGKVLNNAVVHATEPGEGEEDAWHSPASREQVLKTLENYHPTTLKIPNLASEDGIKVHKLFKRDALSSFVRGRTAIVGDAAHVMLPTHAAGGAIAIESAAALETLFRGVQTGDGETIQQRLRMFDELRIPRCNLTMLASNAGAENWLGDPAVEEEIRKYYNGALPPKGAMPWSREFREVLFNHDEFAAAAEMLKKKSI